MYLYTYFWLVLHYSSLIDRAGLRKFGSAHEAIFWWYTLKEIGLEVRNIRRDLTGPIVQICRRIPAPSDTWCVWITIELVIDRMPSRYHHVIEQYFSTGRYVKPFKRWKFAGAWRALCRFFWSELPDELKEWVKSNGIAYRSLPSSLSGPGAMCCS